MRTPMDYAAAYLAKLPPAVSGSGGHNVTFRAACELIRFGLSDHQALALLADYNRACVPPWSDQELTHKIADARRVAGYRHRAFVQPAPPSVRITWKL